MSIQADLKGRLSDGMTPDEAAEFVVAAMTTVHLREYVLPLITEEARDIARRMAQRVEVEALAGSAPLSERIKTIADESFWLPDGRRVTWNAATAEEHRQRAAWQRGLAETITEDAARHEEAAAQIEAAGVRCLAELGQATPDPKTMPGSPAPRKDRRRTPAEKVAA